MPWVLAAVASTFSALSGASVSSSTAVSVTEPLLAVASAGIVSRPPALSVKSPAAGVTVTTVCSLDGCESVAVTVVR